MILSSSAVAAQTAPVPAPETTLGQNGESRLGEDGDVDATTGIIFGLIVFIIAIWVGRSGGPDSP